MSRFSRQLPLYSPGVSVLEDYFVTNYELCMGGGLGELLGESGPERGDTGGRSLGQVLPRSSSVVAVYEVPDLVLYAAVG
jgi:hypothetical protein